MFNKLEERIGARVLLIRGLKIIIIIFLINHWAACALYITACYGRSCNDESWIAEYATEKGKNLSDFSSADNYIIALYWAAATMTSTGYGDITPHTRQDRLVASLVMLTGLFLFGYCVSVLAATLATEDGPRVQFQEKIFAIRAFMKTHQLDINLQNKVTKYLKIMWEKYGGEWIPGSDPLIDAVPMALQQDVLVEDYYLMFQQCPIFQDLDVAFLRMLSSRMTLYTFSPGDNIINAGDFCKSMYIIRRGTCQYVSPKHHLVLTELSSGDYFGGLSMLFQDYQIASVKAKTQVEVVELSKEDLDACLQEFSQLHLQFSQVSEDKDIYHDIRTELNEKLKRAEEKLLSVQEISASHLNTAEDEDMKSRKRSMPSVGKNMKVYEKIEENTDMWDDYMEPFLEIKPVYRVLAKLVLMKRTFLPDGLIWKWWYRIQLIVCLWHAFLSPLLAAIQYEYAFMWGAHYLVDLISFVNLYLGLHMCYQKDGVLVSHPVCTAKQYLYSNFLIDLLGCVPFEVIAVFFDSEDIVSTTHVAAMIHLTRLLQLYRLQVFFTAYEGQVDKAVDNIKQFKFILYSVIFLNAMTCTLLVLACPPIYLLSLFKEQNVFLLHDHHCLTSSWLKNPNIMFNISDAGFVTLYTLSYYWATATTVSVGYGEISAQSNVEMLVALLMMIMGIYFFNYIVASIAASVANADAHKISYQDKLKAIKRYMQDQDIDKSLQEKTMLYYEYIWHRTLGVDPETLFDGLPTPLSEEVTWALYKNSLNKISWFKDFDQTFLRTLSRYIKPVFFRAGDNIVRKNDVGSELYFIYRGVADVVSDDGTVVFESLTEGQSFGEDTWLSDSRRIRNILARTNCDLFILKKGDLDRVLESFPGYKKTILSIATAESRKARRILANKEEQSEMIKKRRGSNMISRNWLLNEVQLSDPESSGFNTGKLFDPASARNFQLERHMYKDQERSKVNQCITSKESFEMSRLSHDEMVTSVYELVDLDERTLNSADNDNNINTLFSSEHQSHHSPLSQFKGIESKNKLESHDEYGDRKDFDQSKQSRLSGRDEDMHTSMMAEERAFSVNIESSHRPIAEEPVVEVKPGMLGKLWMFTINPDNKVYWMFSTVICLLGYISGLLILFEVAYQEHSGIVLGLNYLIDVIFILEIFVKFHVCYYEENGELVENFKFVAVHYYKNHGIGGFLFDVITASPIEILAVFFPSGKKMLALSLLRLIHLLRLFTVFHYFSKWEQKLNNNMMAVRLTHFLVSFSLIVHFLSGAWYGLACPFGSCKTHSWAEGLNINGTLDSLVTGVYWCIATMTSTGYGDVKPVALLEMWLSVIVMITGKLLFGLIYAEIASTIGNHEQQRVHFDQKFKSIQTHMHDQNVPVYLQKNVVKHLNYVWHRNYGNDPKILFRDAPYCLKAEIFLSVNKEMIESIPLLEEADGSFVRHLAPYIGQKIFLPGYDIALKGDVAKELYYIHRGEVEIISENDPDIVETTLSKGAIIGEVNLICSLPCKVTIRAKTYVDILTLAKTDLDDLVQHHPEMKLAIRRQINQRFGKLKF